MSFLNANWLFATRDYTIAPPILDVKLDEYLRSDWIDTIGKLIGFGLEDLFLPKLGKLKSKSKDYDTLLKLEPKADEYKVFGQGLKSKLTELESIWNNSKSESKKIKQELEKLKPVRLKYLNADRGLRHLKSKYEEYKKLTSDLTQLQPESKEYEELNNKLTGLKPKYEEYKKYDQDLKELKPTIQPVLDKFEELQKELKNLESKRTEYETIKKRLDDLSSANEEYEELARKSEDLKVQSKEYKKTDANLKLYRVLYGKALSFLECKDVGVDASELAKMCQEMNLGETEQPKYLSKQLIKDWETVITNQIRSKGTNLPEGTDIKSILAAAASVPDTSKADAATGSLLKPATNIQKASKVIKGINLSDKIPNGLYDDLRELIGYTIHAIQRAHERESGLTNAHVTKLMYISRNARSAVLALFVKKRISNKEEGLSLVDHVVTDKAINPLFAVFAEKESALENVYAYKKILEWKNSKKVSRHQLRAFYKTFLDPASKREINVDSSDCRKPFKSFLEKADRSKLKNVRQDAEFEKVLGAFSKELNSNLSDTYSRFAPAIYSFLKQDNNPRHGNKLRAVKSKLLLYIR